MWNDQQKSDYWIAFLNNRSYIAVIVINCSFLFSLLLYYYIIMVTVFIYFCSLWFLAFIYVKCNLCYGGQLENQMVHLPIILKLSY